MATPERLAPSRRLQSAATAERDRLGRELGRLDAKAQELRAGLDQIEATRAELRDQLSLLARLAHSTEDSPFPLRARHFARSGEEEPPPTKATMRVRVSARRPSAAAVPNRQPVGSEADHEPLRRVARHEARPGRAHPIADIVAAQYRRNRPARRPGSAAQPRAAPACPTPTGRQPRLTGPWMQRFEQERLAPERPDKQKMPLSTGIDVIRTTEWAVLGSNQRPWD